MARRIASVNGAPTSGNGAPPSTLAAQLVHNQNQSQPNAEKATFKELLHEILHNQAAVQETDLKVNAQLINVVAEIGLRPLALDNPFADFDSLIAQGLESLAVIDRTVKTQPDVLLAAVIPGRPQLILSLLATLFALCGKSTTQSLPISQLLGSILHTFASSSNLWQHSGALQEVIQGCVDESLNALEASPNFSLVLGVTLPPARCVARFWSNSGNAIAIPTGTQISITDPVQAFMASLLASETAGLNAFWKREAAQRLTRLAIALKPRIEKTGMWKLALEKLFHNAFDASLLACLLQDVSKVIPPSEIQVTIAEALIERLRQYSKSDRDLLLPSLRATAKSAKFDELHEDLQIAITTWYCRAEQNSNVPASIVAMRDALRLGNVMTNSNLLPAFQELTINQASSLTTMRQRKRRRIADTPTGSRKASVVRRATKLLTGIESEDLSAIADVACSVYANLHEEDKCGVWQALIDVSEFALDVAILTVSRLLELRELHETKRPRILSVIAVGACVERSHDKDYISLATSPLGRHCLASLHSSLRELRIAAGQVLPYFLRENVPEDVRSQNRQLALKYLRDLSSKDITSEQETMIPAWGLIALSCSDKELNLVLLRLVEYLGHSNSLVCAVASSEIEKIASARGQNAEQLFEPFWRSIAVSVVQDLNVKPQKAQQLCELLSMDINQFLLMTQQETLPALVLTRKKDVLQRIANARGNGSTVEDICLQPRTNLAAVLSLLLIQPSADVEETALDCLSDVAPGFKFKDSDLSSLVKMDPVLIACEMLKHCGDEGESSKSRSYQSFQVFANLAERERTQGQRKTQTKSSRTMAAFFEDKLLGILTQFSVNISGGQGAQSKSERVRCLKGLAEIFTLTKGNVSHALPQIKACLQSGLEQADLCETAFNAWLSMLGVLDSEEIANIIDETFVVVVRFWPNLSSNLQTKTHKAIGDLVRAHNKILQENIMTLPSLAGIPQLSKFAAEFDRFKKQESVENHFKAFSKRLKSDSSAVAIHTLTELVPFLEIQQDFVHETAASDNPLPVLSDLLRALLDATVKYSGTDLVAAEFCGKALGIIGSLDPNRIEAPRLKRQVLLLSNFEKASEAIDWTMTLLEDVMVKVFKSATNARAQGFLAYTMQELLRFCRVSDSTPRSRGTQPSGANQRWNDMPEQVRMTLTPFLTSKYLVTSVNPVTAPRRAYPSFSIDTSHSQWLRSITYDLMFKAKGENAQMVFPLLARTIRGHDLAIARFVFPYAVLNLVLGGTVTEIRGLTDEFLQVLKSFGSNASQDEAIRLCSESVFDVLDSMSTWLMEKKKALANARGEAYKTGHTSHEFDEAKDMGQVESVEKFLASIPAEVVANAAIDCRSFARALCHWEQFIRKGRPLILNGQPQMSMDESQMYERLLEIYTEIDEPDGLEGISAHLPIISEQQQAINHEKAGRWTAAQAWYEVQLAESPGVIEMQAELLRCLRETGRYAPLLRYVDSFIDQAVDDDATAEMNDRLFPLTAEACWMTGDLDGLSKRLTLQPPTPNDDFYIGVGKVLLHAREHSAEALSRELSRLRRSITESLSLASTDSLQACHPKTFELHVLYELEALNNAAAAPPILQTFEKRLTVVGSYLQDKQLILGLRRAVMRLRSDIFQDAQIGSTWLTTARLARQTKDTDNAYNAVLRASECGSRGAKLEEARLLWHDGHQRQAIQSLEAAIKSGVFEDENGFSDSKVVDLTESTESTSSHMQNALLGKALLLLAKWLDASGQSQTKDMTARYQTAARSLQRGERGHYYLSKHYTKLLDAQKALPKEKRADSFATGEMTKLVLDNCLRSLPFGSKYWHETIPRLLTLWLELGTDCMHKAPREDQTIFDKRVKTLQSCNRQVQKYFERVPAYVFYHALPQLISRLTHPHPDIWKQLSNILTRIASAHPSQVLWSLLAVVKANDRTRVERGTEILNRLKDPKLKIKTDATNGDLRTMITHGQRLSDGLLQACEEPVEARATHVSLARNLRFNHKLAPSSLVVPIETTLIARSPPAGANSDQIKRYKAFAQDKITITAFSDDVLVLGSLQRPRKITVLGSDGRHYGLLCKPKDDLRKDQRLMEFNGIINRALKRDTESSKRRLYIKTYAVTPLSEESGTIEWVEGIKPVRDILLNLYIRKGIRPNYNEIRKKLDEACTRPENAHIFTKLLENEFPPTLHEWFTETYPEPETWFAARLRYARSAAVMSMTGHMLGLGDRHGENILLEESTGGVFHVDFNCLFDKGLTFEKPEMVPFRLTHNMVDAMGAYGYEGPFRKSCELTLGLLRQERDTLMTVLETFLYDPTTDFVGRKKRSTAGVPETPAEILESVATKLKGLLKGETVPLSVEGYVDALIQEATSPFRLASMYIGWCSFL